MFPFRLPIISNGKLKRDIFVKIIVTNVLCIACLSVLNYLLCNTISNRMVIATLMDQNNQIQSQAFQNIEDTMESANRILAVLTAGLSGDEELHYPSNQDVFRSPSKAKALIAKLRDIALNFPIVERIDLYYPATQTAVTGFHLHQIGTAQKRNQVLPWLETLEIVPSFPAFLPCGDHAYLLDDQPITLVTRWPLGISRPAQTFAAIHISRQAISSYIDEVSGSFLLFNTNQELLYETSGKPPYAELALAEMARLPQRNSDVQSVQVLAENENLILTCRTYASLGLSLCYIIPYQQFSAYNNPYMTVFLIACALFVLVNTIAIAMLSYSGNQAYRSRILHLTNKAGLPAATVDESISNLAKTFDSLRQRASQSQAVQLRIAIHTLLLNPNAAQSWQLFSQDCHGSHALVIIAQVYPQPGDIQALGALVQQWLTDCQVFSAALVPGECVLVVIGKPEKLQVSASIVATELPAFCQDAYMNASALHAVSPEVLHQAYTEAVQARDYRFIYPQQPLIPWEQLSLSHRKSSGSHLHFFDQMNRLLDAERYVDFRNYLGQFLTGFRLGDYTLAYCLSTLRDTVGLLYRHLQQIASDKAPLFEYDIRAYFSEIADIDAYELWMGGLLDALVAHQQQEQAGRDETLKKRLAELIEQYLEKDISLQLLSEQIGIRGDLLSRQFSLLFGTNYSDYIRQLKMNRAVCLLMNHIPVKDIACRLGYRSSHYFIQLFKEQYGTTPYQYYKQTMESKNQG